jgi:hypothetical protein
MLRDEALPIYFSQHHFNVALQSYTGMDMALSWIRTLSQSCLLAFNHLRHLKFIVGLGVRDRPEEFVLDLERREIVSCRTQLPQRTLMLGENICGHPGFRYLRYELARMPDRRGEGFDLARGLEPIMLSLFREFTLEDAYAVMLH